MEVCVGRRASAGRSINRLTTELGASVGSLVIEREDYSQTSITVRVVTVQPEGRHEFVTGASPLALNKEGLGTRLLVGITY